MLDREGLIEIGRAQRIERHEWDGRSVDAVREGLPCGRFGGSFGLGRERGRQLELAADRSEPVTERLRSVA
ncbi:MAG TPA: hypothetical protein VE989_13510 [Sphingomicrobium sp.]|nr:hypothetical protein [Sphingomicrobium sp.]